MNAEEIAGIIRKHLNGIDKAKCLDMYLSRTPQLAHEIRSAADEIVSLSAKDAKPAATLPDVSDVELTAIRCYLSNDGKTQVQYEKCASGDDMNWKIGDGSWMDAGKFIRDHSDLLPLREAVAGEVAR
jgi:hypothetical protein